MNNALYTAIFCLLLTSCVIFEGPEETIWIFPYKVNGPLASNPSEGIFFLVSDSTDLDYSLKSWTRKEENFEIKGFDFEPGNYYQLSVRRRENSPNKLVLKSILEKRKDYAYNLEGQWVGISDPEVSFRFSELIVNKFSRIATISTGCDWFYFNLGEITEDKVSLNGSLMSIRSTCGKPSPWTPPYSGPSMSEILNQITSYRIDPNGFLNFYDEEGTPILRFQPSE